MKIIQDSITYLLDANSKTACIINGQSARGDVLIPRSIVHESREYLITTISEEAFKQASDIKSLQFSNDSELQKIENQSFIDSSINIISIPSCVSLDSKWCCYATNLVKVKVIETGKKCNIIDYDQKLILGKSNEASEIFDVVLFAQRNQEKITIPNFVTKISPFSFSVSMIKSIKIPSSVTRICEGAFSMCERLIKVEIEDNSNLKVIEKDAFLASSIESLSIPSNIIELKNEWCNGTYYLNDVKVIPNGEENIIDFNNEFILGKSDLKNDDYDVLLFSKRNLEFVMIPDLVKIITPYSFSESSVKEVILPSSLTKICEYSFSYSLNLKKIKFITKNSSLQIIENFTFLNSTIECISIPSDIIELNDGWCCGARYLKRINVIKNEKENIINFKKKFILGKSDLNSDVYDKLLFMPRHLKKARIPDFIKIISVYAFSESLIDCISIPSNIIQIGEGAFQSSQLAQIEFSKDTKFEIIEKNMFNYTKLEKISISSRIKKICEGAFYFCKYFERIDIPNNSELQVIERDVFACTQIRCIFIPSLISFIGENAFENCYCLQLIEIADKSTLQKINKNVFNECNNASIFVPV